MSKVVVVAQEGNITLPSVNAMKKLLGKTQMEQEITRTTAHAA
jgi:hypothetical protein